MKLPRLLIFAALSFAVGALLATRHQADALRSALRPDAPLSATENRAGKKPAGTGASSDEDRFGHLFSLPGGSLLKYRHDLYEAIGELRADEVAAMTDRAARLPARRASPHQFL